MSINSCNLQGKQEVIHQKKGLILKEGIIGPEPYANTKETSVIKYIGSQSQYSTLFCLNKWAIPFVSVFTAVDLASIRNADLFIQTKQNNSPPIPIDQCPSFSIFGHVTCHVTMIKR